FSAWGLLLQDLSRSAARTIVAPLSAKGLDDASAVIRQLGSDLDARSAASQPALATDQTSTASLDLRFQGQEYFLSVEVPFSDGNVAADPNAVRASFEGDYEKRYGHVLSSPLEIVAARVTSVTPLPKTNLLSAPPLRREPTPRRAVEAFSFVAGERTEFDVLDRASFGPGDRASGPAIVLEETATT